MVKPGTYSAKVLSHAISETKAGNPQAVIKFSFESDGAPHTLTYFGSFSEKAAPHTIKALLTCGLQGSNPAGPLEIGKDVLIVVEDEVGEDGKTRSKIRWVNEAGQIRNIIPQDAAKAKLSNLEGLVMMQKQKLGVTDDSDPIPF